MFHANITLAMGMYVFFVWVIICKIVSESSLMKEDAGPKKTISIDCSIFKLLSISS